MKGVILAGGSGTRLWPLSRDNYPKQFLKLNGGKSLIQQTAERLLRLLSEEDIIVLTNDNYKFHVRADLESISPAFNKHIILEPEKRNTAPAIALVVKYCIEILNCGRDEVIFISPSDHIITPDESFVDALIKAEQIAKQGYIVTFGIKPIRPETGYGYIKIRGQESGIIRQDFYKIENFVEKPDLEAAKKYIEEGNYFWNSGMFAFSIGTIIEEFNQLSPDISNNLKLSFKELIANFKEMPNISIDYAIMERSDKVVTMPLDIYWNDIGSWDSLVEMFKQDSKGNVKIGDVIEVNTSNSLIIGDSRLIAAVGIDNLLVAETDDAILIAKRGESQNVKDVVKLLKSNNRVEAVEHKTVYRPWGQYTILEEGLRYKIKRIVVKPGERLSLQMHHHRSEHWVVVKGTAKVTIDDKEIFIHENESAYVPKSTAHRLENPGRLPLEIIEVQNGEYLGEDDIKRFDDIYGRTKD